MTGKAPWPLMEVAVEPRSRADADRLVPVLRELAGEDPAFSFHVDPESGLVILGGEGERHLDQNVTALIEAHGLEFNVGQPQVAYRETLGRPAEVDHTHKQFAGGVGQFARVRLTFEPGQPGSGFVFETRIVDGAVPEDFIPGVIRGLEQGRENGLLAGFPVIDFKATLVGGAWHDLDSSALAFEIAARAAFRELREKAQPMLLEPIMGIEVETPEEYLGSVIGDLRSRRGVILDREAQGDLVKVTALAPLSNLFGYGMTSRGMTDGRAEFAMAYDHYAPVPLPDVDGPDDVFPPAAAMRA